MVVCCLLLHIALIEVFLLVFVLLSTAACLVEKSRGDRRLWATDNQEWRLALCFHVHLRRNWLIVHVLSRVATLSKSWVAMIHILWMKLASSTTTSTTYSISLWLPYGFNNYRVFTSALLIQIYYCNHFYMVVSSCRRWLKSINEMKRCRCEARKEWAFGAKATAS